MRCFGLIAVLSGVTAAAVSGECTLSPGKTYVHAQRAFRQISPETVEVVSVHTLWNVSATDMLVDIGMVHSRVLMSGTGRGKDERTTEYLVNKVEYSVDPDSCELTLGDIWFKLLRGEKFRYRGDLAKADVAKISANSTRITGEAKDPVSIVNDVESKHVLGMYNSVRSETEQMGFFKVKAVGGDIEIGGSGGVVLKKDLNAGSDVASMWKLRDEYRTGTGVGAIDWQGASSMLTGNAFASIPLADAPVILNPPLTCKRTLLPSTSYMFEERVIQATSSEEAEIVSMHVRWTTHADATMVDIEVLHNKIYVWNNADRISTRTDYVAFESVPIQLDDVSCRLTLSGSWLGEWEFVRYSFLGQPRPPQSSLAGSAGTVVFGETMVRMKFPKGHESYFLRELNHIKPVNERMGGYDASLVDKGIRVGDRHGWVFLKTVGEECVDLELLRDNYRSGLGRGRIGKAMVDIAFGPMGKLKEWQRLPLALKTPLAIVPAAQIELAEEDTVGIEKVREKQIGSGRMRPVEPHSMASWDKSGSLGVSVWSGLFVVLLLTTVVALEG